MTSVTELQQFQFPTVFFYQTEEKQHVPISHQSCADCGYRKWKSSLKRPTEPLRFIGFFSFGPDGPIQKEK